MYQFPVTQHCGKIDFHVFNVLVIGTTEPVHDNLKNNPTCNIVMVV